MTIKKLYLDEFGNVITAEDGDSMSNGLLLNGVGLSAGREPNQNTEELVKRWNAYDANQQEIAELKAMVNVLRRAADLYHGGYKVSELEEAAAIMNMSPAQCLQSEKADVIKTIISDINIGYANCELNCDDILDYLNGEETKLREGKS